jgi:hypothetical protein
VKESIVFPASDLNVFSYVVRSDDDPNVFLVNDFEDPLQVCYPTVVS